MSIYKCPVCGKLLELEAKRYCCENNHSFDIAKEGYVNLLLANQKNSDDPGDNKEMIASRRDFLNLGHYDRLSDALNIVIAPFVSEKSSDFNLLDVGCGEGFYLSKLRQYLGDKHPLASYHLYGSDISKWGIKSASKRDKDSHFSVASLYHLPIQDDSIDCLTRIFAPKSFAEFARVLKPEGIFISVVPAGKHLMGLKQIIYDNPTVHPEANDPDTDIYFTHHEQVHVKYDIHVQGTENILNLVKMTPYYWTMSKETSGTVASLTHIDLEVDCHLNIYQKRPLI